MNQVAIELFGIGDETMVEPTIKNSEKLIFLEKNNFVCYKADNKPVAWSLVLPTSRENAEKFLSGVITESELFNESIKKPSFESLYLFAVITMPNYRKNGLGSSLMKYQILYFKKKYQVNDFYAWILSLEGEKLAESLKKYVEPTIRFISKI